MVHCRLKLTYPLIHEFLVLGFGITLKSITSDNSFNLENICCPSLLLSAIIITRKAWSGNLVRLSKTKKGFVVFLNQIFWERFLAVVVSV